MPLPFLNGSARKKRDQIVAVDLGGRTTKAVLLVRHGEIMALSKYAILDAPRANDKRPAPEVLAEHLKAVSEALGATTKQITLAIGLDEALVRQVELPQIPLSEMRVILKNNAKSYLQQELNNHFLDFHIFIPKASPPPTGGKPGEAAKPAIAPKLKVLVAAAKQQVINDYSAAIKLAGLVPDFIVPGLLGALNSFEIALPEVYNGDPVALVDIGFKHTSICVLDRGELALTRVVNIGGDKLTAGLAETMNISYAEAEGIKVGMAPEVLSSLELQVLPLGRELRASLDFFEHQQDRTISHIYITGGSSCSEMIMEMLRTELVAECRTWNPTGSLQLALSGQQVADIEHLSTQLVVAIGAGLSVC
jgi:type IV pilus assembly protein PilM